MLIDEIYGYNIKAVNELIVFYLDWQHELFILFLIIEFWIPVNCLRNNILDATISHLADFIIY